MKSRIMYIEPKDGTACAVEGEARIGRVTFSKTGKTLYYRGLEFQSLGGRGYKANYVELGTGTRYWISGCRKDGCDALYSTVVDIDDDVREEYWRTIREVPGRAAERSFRSPGKHTKSGRVGEGSADAELPGRRSGR